VFRAVDRPKYDERLNAQVEAAIQSQGPGDLDALFREGDTWKVEG
jgi:2-oxoglutarate ferredoxin oxidoreductase subunit beta